MKKFAIFASGSGTNFQAIIDTLKEEQWPAKAAIVICDKPGAKVLERAEKEGIPSFSFTPKAFPSKAAFEQTIIEQLKLHEVEWIFLAGYMRLIGPTLLDAFRGKIVNIHPSLLPAFMDSMRLDKPIKQESKWLASRFIMSTKAWIPARLLIKQPFILNKGKTLNPLKKECMN